MMYRSSIRLSIEYKMMYRSSIRPLHDIKTINIILHIIKVYTIIFYKNVWYVAGIRSVEENERRNIQKAEILPLTLSKNS